MSAQTEKLFEQAKSFANDMETFINEVEILMARTESLAEDYALAIEIMGDDVDEDELDECREIRKGVIEQIAKVKGML